MNAAPPAPPQRRSNRDAGVGDQRIADRRNRATTVSPERLVKLTKKRPLAAVGRERQAEQPPLAACKHDSDASRGSRPGQHRAVAHDSDRPALLDDELDAAIEWILNERDRCGEAGRIDLQAKPALRDEHDDARDDACAEHDCGVEPAARSHPRIVDDDVAVSADTARGYRAIMKAR